MSDSIPVNLKVAAVTAALELYDKCETFEESFEHFRAAYLAILELLMVEIGSSGPGSSDKFAYLR